MQDAEEESPVRRIERYLELAQQALRAAAKSRTADMRQAYVGIANSWMDLADRVRRLERHD